MKHKEIQEERMRGYFIEATKAIIKGEGIRGVNVRSVADHAGYSFATIYNYFRDVNDLLFHCVQDFQQECVRYSGEQVGKSNNCRERLKAKVAAYIRFFTEYPGIFELFYTARAGDLGNRERTLDIIDTSLDEVCRPEWEYCLQHGNVTTESLEHVKTLLRYAVAGILLMYINRRRPSDYTVFLRKCEQITGSILKDL